MPRLVLLTNCAATILIVGGFRSLWRVTVEEVLPWFHRREYRPALLLGARAADKILALHLQSHPELPFRICGFLDKTPRWLRQSYGGVPVVGQFDDLLNVARQRRVADVITITGSLPGHELRRLRATCETATMQFHVLPPLNQLVSSHKLLSVKPLEIESLLQREPIRLDDHTVRAALRGEAILVTGAGGSIGSEICRQLLPFNHAR